MKALVMLSSRLNLTVKKSHPKSIRMRFSSSFHGSFSLALSIRCGIRLANSLTMTEERVMNGTVLLCLLEIEQ